MATATARILDPEGPSHTEEEQAFIEEIKLGLDRMRRMSHDELREVIARRVNLLENTLKEREQRREAIDTARMASQILELRRDRTRRIKRQVDGISVMSAVFGTVLLFAVIL